MDAGVVIVTKGERTIGRGDGGCAAVGVAIGGVADDPALGVTGEVIEDVAVCLGVDGFGRKAPTYASQIAARISVAVKNNKVLRVKMFMCFLCVRLY